MGLAHSPRIVRDGLVLYLDAANPKSYPGSGTTWSDLSGNGNDGTLVNGVGYDSANNGSMVFDGSNGYVDIDNLVYTDHTIEGWIYSGNGSQGGRTGGTIVSAIGTYRTSSGSAGKYTYIGFLGSNTLTFRIDDGNSSHTEVADVTYSANQWYHAALRYNSNGSATAYLNGSQVGSRNYTANIVFDSVPNYIGRAESGNIFDGKISNVKIYNRALSESEIRQNFEALRGRYGV